MAQLDLPATFVDDVSVPLSAADLNILRDTAMLLDGLSLRRVNATPSSGPQTTGDAAEWHSRGDYRQSWWGLYYRTGMTTLTIIGRCASQIDFYLDGAFNSSQATSAGFTKNITLTGYSDGDVVLLEIKTNGNSSAAPAGYSGLYRIDDVYGSPVTVTSSWPGVPTFAGTYNAARLNQLRDACQNLWDRITAVPMQPMVGMIYIPATHRAETIRLFDGAVARYNSSEVLRIVGTFQCRTDQEHYEIDYNGSTAVTSSNYVSGQTVSINHAITLTHTTGTYAPIAIRTVVTDDTNTRAVPSSFSLYSFIAIRTEATSGYATASPPTVFTAEESISAATLNTRLNGIATMLSTIDSRLTTAANLWGRARAFRRVFAKDDTQVARNLKRHSALFQRRGDTLIVRGKGVKIGWGAIAVDPPGENEPVNYAKFKFAFEQSVGAEDKIETNVVPLDGLAGLQPAMLYYVWGQVLEFAGELVN